MPKKNRSLTMVAGAPKQSKAQKQKKSRNKDITRYKAHINAPLSNRGKVNRACLDKLCAAVCSQIDPFCAQACGAKRLDETTTKSIPMQFRVLTDLQQLTALGGTAGTQIQPNLANVYRRATAATTRDLNVWGAWAAFPGYSTANFSGYRVVSGGAHIFTISPPTAANGVVGVFTHLGAAPATVDLASSLYTDVYRDTRYNNEFCVTFKSEGKQANSYIAISDTSSPAWTTHTIFGDLMTLVNNEFVSFIEITLNVEIHAVEETTYSLIQAGASPAVPQVEAIAANTLAALNPVTVGDQANASKVAKSTAWEQVNKAVEFMAPLALEALMLLI